MKRVVINVNTYRCPRVAKKLHNLFVIKDINFFFFLDDSYASTAYSENIAVYIQGVPELAPQRKQACADNKKDSKLTKINFLLAQITELQSF
jgi:hypothetical protein